MQKFSIRDAVKRDSEGIARTRVEGWQAGYRGIMPDAFLDDMSVEEDVERMQNWSWDPQTTPQWVVETDGEIVGWGCMSMPSRDESLGPHVAEIVACYVRPASWRLGFGQQLMRVALDAARDRGFTDVVLWVLEDNDRAQRFYAQLGFELDGATQSMDRVPGVKLVVARMRLSL